MDSIEQKVVVFIQQLEDDMEKFFQGEYFGKVKSVSLRFMYMYNNVCLNIFVVFVICVNILLVIYDMDLIYFLIQI